MLLQQIEHDSIRSHPGLLCFFAPCHVTSCLLNAPQDRTEGTASNAHLSVQSSAKKHLATCVCRFIRGFRLRGLPESASLPGPRDGAQGTVTKLLPNPPGRKISEWAPTRLSSPVRKKRRMTGLQGDFPFKIFRAFSGSVRPQKHLLTLTPPPPRHVAELSGDVSPPLGLPNCSRNLVSRGRSAFDGGRNGGKRSKGYIPRIERCR